MSRLHNERNVAIMYIRIVAMLFIFTDHAVAYMDVPLKSVIMQITNSGNLIFLFISGFLYGGKSIDNFGAWINKRIERLWVPYFIFILVFFVLEVVRGAGSEIIKPLVVYAFVLQGLLGPEGGPQTLWFMTLLILCYCLIPLLQLIRDSAPSASDSKPVVPAAIALTVLSQVLLAYHCNLTLDFGHPLSWYVAAIFVFCCGYFSNRSIVSSGITSRKLAIWTAVMCVSMGIRVIAQRLIDGTVLYDRVISIWTNAILDIWIVYFIYYFVSKAQTRFDYEIIRQGDRISYAFYLAHALVLELCSVVSPSEASFVVTAFALSVISAYCLNYVSHNIVEFIAHKRGIERFA